MASHVRTSIVAIVVLVLAVPVLFWLKSLGLVLGDPWVLALLLLLVIFVSDDRSQQQLGSGRLDGRPLFRLVLAGLLATVLLPQGPAGHVQGADHQEGGDHHRDADH